MKKKVKNLRIFAGRLKGARDEKGMTELELAQEVAVSVSSVKCWEKGITNINSINLGKLSQVLGVSEEYLTGEVDENQITEAENSGLFTQNCNHAIDISTVKKLVNKLVCDRNLSEEKHTIVNHALAIIETALNE